MRKFLHLVRGIATFEVRAKRPALDGLGQNYRRLTSVSFSCCVGGIHLLVIMATTL